MRHSIRILTGTLLCGVLLLCPTANAATYDMDGDHNLTAFDYVLKKRECMEHPESAAFYEMFEIDAHILGFASLPLSTPAITEPEPLLEPKHTIHTGDATYYSGGISSGRCSLAPIPDGMYVTAINTTDYQNGLLAGAYLRVTAENGKTVDVYVTDTSGQGAGHLDLNTSAFQQLAATSAGRLNISWEIIPFPTENPMVYKFSADSSASWFSMQVRYHIYPIYSIEIQQPNGSFVPLTRRSDNYFTCSGGGSGILTFRLTDIYGNIVTDSIPLSPGETVSGTVNFPQ